MAILREHPINAMGIKVPDDSPYSVGKKAFEWECDGCKCRGDASDTRVWNCACSCHDGWKFGQDGGRFREQVANGLAGVDLRSAGWFDIVDNHASGHD